LEQAVARRTVRPIQVEYYLVNELGYTLYDAGSMTFDELVELFEELVAQRTLLESLGSPPTKMQKNIWKTLYAVP
jgi:hypothetical protein